MIWSPPQTIFGNDERPKRRRPGGQDGQEGGEMVDRVLLAHAVVRPRPKGQEVALVLHVLPPLLGEAVGVELLCIWVPLQQVWSAE